MEGLDILVEVIPNLPSVLLVWIVLLFLYLLLKQLLYNPVNKFLEERKGKIETDMAEAKRLNSEAEELKLEYESRISDARAESQKILAEARARGEELKNEILSEARQEAETIKARASKDIERERQAAFESVKSETGNMALLIASKIMEKEINLKNQEELMNKFIDEVGSTPWQN